MNSPLNHEGPVRQRPPGEAQRLAVLPLETSLVPLQMHQASPYKDYLCGSSNPVSKKKKNNKRKNRDSGNVSFSPPYSNANQCPAQLYV